jgi:hypothetical protein
MPVPQRIATFDNDGTLWSLAPRRQPKEKHYVERNGYSG